VAESFGLKYQIRVGQSILGGDCVQEKISIRGINISLRVITVWSKLSGIFWAQILI
jgi:hypothetical protein